MTIQYQGEFEDKRRKWDRQGLVRADQSWSLGAMSESELMGAIGGQGMGLEKDFDDDLLLISAVRLDLVQGNGADVKTSSPKDLFCLFISAL